MTQRMKIIAYLIVSITVVWIGRARAAGIPADWVLYNGKILTANTDDPNGFRTAQAVAIYDGKYVAVGTNQEALDLAGPATKKIDLGSRMVLPGLVETHLHVHGMALSHYLGRSLNATDPPIQWKRKSEGLAQLRTLALQKKPGEWIIVEVRGAPPGMRLGVPTPETPTLAELDAAAPNNPITVGGGEYFPALVNSKTLELLYKKYPQGVPGIIKGPDGKPTGTLKVTAAMVLSELWPELTQKRVQDLAPLFKKELEEAAARGLTTLATRVDWDSLRIFEYLDEQEELPIRFAYATQMAAYTPYSDLLFRRVPMLSGHGTPWLWLSGATTGTLEYGNGPANQDACLHKDYPREAEKFPIWKDQPFGPHGECRLTEGEDSTILRNFFLNAAKNGWAVTNLHVKGDRALDDYLDLLEEANQKYGIANLRFSADHCGFIADEQAKRAKALGMTLTCQFPSPTGDDGQRGTLGAYRAIYGVEKAGDVVAPYKRLITAGLKPSAHCESHKGWAFACMQYEITRKDDMDGHIWGPQQRITRQEALYTYTRWASWHVWKEKNIGSIEPGKWGDLVVIDKDFLTVPEDEITDINPLLTIAGGKITYSEPKFASSVGLPTTGFQAPPNWWERKGPKTGEGM